MLIDFCLPIKNEEKILYSNVLKLRDFLIKNDYSFEWQIVMIINGSNDNSLSIAKKIKNIDSKHFLIKSIKDGGKGLALKTYFKESNADLLVFMDVDMAASLENITNLLSPLLTDEADLVVGSRFLLGSKMKSSFTRRIISHNYNYLARYFLGHHINDLQCGFKAMKRSLFNEIYKYLLDDKWFFDTELIVFSYNLGYRLKEIPVDWIDSRFETRKSKVKIFSDSFVFFINLLNLKKRLLLIKKLSNIN